MSTCKGAPAPHDDCPHGSSCDWDGGAIVLGRPPVRGGRPPMMKFGPPVTQARRETPKPTRAERRAAQKARRTR